MIHPDILRSYIYRRTECRMSCIDACADAAEFYGLPARRLAEFLCAVGIDNVYLIRI